MMNRLLSKIFLSLIFVCVAASSFAQYYSWGADRSSLKWSLIDADSVKILFPDTVNTTAHRMMHYVEAVRSNGDISYGLEHSPLDATFVVHPENFVSNGMVMWAPLRIEFLSTPAVDNYSMPWIKQLVAHEYRHAVQYNNMDRSTLGVFKYIFGQQGSALSLLFPSLYALEGDAVMMETQMSTYGRGLQPSFSIGYRAMADEILTRKDYLKWRCGSYTENIPDHYRMGYQMMSYAGAKYGENILDKTFRYISRNPQFIIPYTFALNKYYDTSSKKLFYETFEELTAFWAPQAEVENSAEMLTSGQKRNFITYSHPIILEDGRVLTLKSDYRDPSRFVVFDPESSTEETVAHTGYPSTRPAYAANRVWWTEYRRSVLFAQDYNSQLCYMDLEDGRPRDFKGHINALYPTPMRGVKNEIAYVEYDPSGQYTVVELLDNRVLSRTEVTYPLEVHSMAWDDLTERLYIIVTGDEGMWIEQQTESGFEPLTKPAYITISDLRAEGGVLYFGSIASGKDEVHSLDIASGVERQLSQSTYGSFQGVSADGKLYLTTYDKQGYHLARQSADEYIQEVEFASVPTNLLNPERPKWDVINLDTVKFDKVELVENQTKYPNQKYRKGTHLFNIHSWAPISYDPFTILTESSLDIGLGATIVSQNLLSSCEAFLSYGWDSFQGSVVQGGVNYDGWGIELGLSATYGGDQKLYLLNSYSPLGTYSDLNLSATLPLYFAKGYHTRQLNFYAGWNYSNGVVPIGLSSQTTIDPETGSEQLNIYYREIKTGLNKLSLGVSFSDNVQSATQNLATPFGYAASFSYGLDPYISDFSHLVSLYGVLYTPGVAKNNSFKVAAAYQNAIGGFEISGYRPLSYVSAALIPTGFSYLDISNSNYLAASAEYKFPVCYPNYGLFDVLYFKRLSLGLGVDYAQFDSSYLSSNNLYSYGGSLLLDFNALSLTSASTLSATFSLYKPKDRSLYFEFGFSLPF